MMPAASVSGIYLAHPDVAVLLRRPRRARPGRGLRARKGIALDEAERWLRPNLAYEPDAPTAQRVPA